MSAILDRVQIEAAPVVEIDTEAPAAYIRVSQNPVSRTVDYEMTKFSQR